MQTPASQWQVLLGSGDERRDRLRYGEALVRLIFAKINALCDV